MPQTYCGSGSAVDIATGCGLDGPRIESRWGARFSAPVQTGLGAHPTSCTLGTRSFPGVKSGRGVTLTPHPLLVPWSRKSRAIPLLPLWVVRPVQSVSACTRVHFTFYFTIIPLLSARKAGTRQKVRTLVFPFDTQKVFDKACHIGLVYKLIKMHFHDYLIRLTTSSFLQNLSPISEFIGEHNFRHLL